MYVNNVLDPNSQKTHYSLQFPERKRANATSKLAKRHQPKLTSASETPTDHHLPFKSLSQETREHVAHRYNLYEKVWGYQKLATETILNSANKDLFADMLKFIKDPVSDKLDTAFLGLGSNIANNLRILDEFTGSVSGDPNAPCIRIVRLNSKVCVNIKNTIKEVVKQVVQGVAVLEQLAQGEGINDAFDQDSADEQTDRANHAGKNDDIDEDSDSEDISEAEEDNQQGEVDGGRIAYDFEIVQEWVESFNKRAKSSGLLRIVIILDDSDGFSNETLNQIIQLFCVHRCRCPVKMIMGLSTKNVSDWISSNITSKLRSLIRGVRLESKENKDIGFQVINAILLQNEITPKNPLLLDAQLSLIILSRFENSNNSIDSLITELKLAYMIYFYQLPLASLLDPGFQPQSFHFDGLRKLPSFKTHIESLVHKFEENVKILNTGSKSVKSQLKLLRKEILDLLKNDGTLYELFSDARARFERFQNSVMNAVNIIYWLSKGTKEKFQIYKLVTSNQLVNSAFLSDLLKKIKLYTEDERARFEQFVLGETIKTHVGGHRDEDVIKFVEKIQCRAGDLVENITYYLHTNRNINIKISDNLFNEVLTISGGKSEIDELRPKVSIEESYENLMINLIRPNTREILEMGMDEPQKYLRNPVLLDSMDFQAKESRSSRLAGPSLCKLYQIYKDAPVNINLWDFFTAFKQSLPKQDIVREISASLKSSDLAQTFLDMFSSGTISDDTWDRMSYAWFIQGCHELASMGFLKEKNKGDYVEKLVWKNL